MYWFFSAKEINECIPEYKWSDFLTYLWSTLTFGVRDGAVLRSSALPAAIGVRIGVEGILSSLEAIESWYVRYKWNYGMDLLAIHQLDHPVRQFVRVYERHSCSTYLVGVLSLFDRHSSERLRRRLRRGVTISLENRRICAYEEDTYNDLHWRRVVAVVDDLDIAIRKDLSWLLPFLPAP